ncbi:MAG: cofactor-independent phosphoglycerate mutase [Oscillospiraceae bacterium]|nr:cofactor-independent phosphoglycerate mutase [Oscillospiraceae bacterium]
MKYLVVLGDGMADYPVPELGCKTPLQYANKPNMDFIAKNGATGLVRTIPDGVSAGSDTANMSVMGFDPKTYYTGRSPIEAVSMGIRLSDDDVAFRCNLVTLSEGGVYEDKTMLDYSSDEISSEEAREIIGSVNENVSIDSIKFYPGISYRHCMVWKGAGFTSENTPPHDILGKRIGEYLPRDKAAPDQAGILNLLMRKSHDYLSRHPVNKARSARGLKPANSIWLWGQGTRMVIPSFREKFGISGVVISAVDLIKGIGLSCGLDPIYVEGATGIIDTNYEGKARAAVEAFKKGYDFAYIHIEAPDECGHRYEIDNKVRAIELIDSRVMPIVMEGLESFDDYSIIVLPDHPTPLSLRTHTREPVPFAVYSKKRRRRDPVISGYDEFSAQKTGLFIDRGHELMDEFISRDCENLIRPIT